TAPPTHAFARATARKYPEWRFILEHHLLAPARRTGFANGSAAARPRRHCRRLVGPATAARTALVRMDRARFQRPRTLAVAGPLHCRAARRGNRAAGPGHSRIVHRRPFTGRIRWP